MKILPEIDSSRLLQNINENSIKKNENKKDPKLWKAVQDFKSILIYQMLKSMRDTIVQSGLTEEAPGKDYFMSLFDQEVSRTMAQRQNDFLSEVLYQQLAGEKTTPQSGKGSLQIPLPPVQNPDQIKINSLKQSNNDSQDYYQAKVLKRIEQFEGIIQEASKTYQVDSDLIKAVIAQESGGDPTVVSHKGATGLMQLMAATASEMGVSNINDPRENIFGGTKYLKLMLQRFNGDISLALAGYNAGPAAVEKYSGIPPYKETINYVKRVHKYYEILKNI